METVLNTIADANPCSAFIFCEHGTGKYFVFETRDEFENEYFDPFWKHCNGYEGSPPRNEVVLNVEKRLIVPHLNDLVTFVATGEAIDFFIDIGMLINASGEMISKVYPIDEGTMFPACDWHVTMIEEAEENPGTKFWVLSYDNELLRQVIADMAPDCIVIFRTHHPDHFEDYRYHTWRVFSPDSDNNWTHDGSMSKRFTEDVSAESDDTSDDISELFDVVVITTTDGVIDWDQASHTEFQMTEWRQQWIEMEKRHSEEREEMLSRLPTE